MQLIMQLLSNSEQGGNDLALRAAGEQGLGAKRGTGCCKRARASERTQESERG